MTQRIKHWMNTDIDEARAEGLLDGVDDAAAAWLDEHGWWVRGKYEVCGRCDGSGVHDNPAFSNGFTGEEMDEAGPEFREEYMAGHYDVTCTGCGGKRVAWVIDDTQDAPQRQALAEELNRWANEIGELEAEEAAERRMGA